MLVNQPTYRESNAQKIGSQVYFKEILKVLLVQRTGKVPSSSEIWWVIFEYYYFQF